MVCVCVWCVCPSSLCCVRLSHWLFFLTRAGWAHRHPALSGRHPSRHISRKRTGSRPRTGARSPVPATTPPADLETHQARESWLRFHGATSQTTGIHIAHPVTLLHVHDQCDRGRPCKSQTPSPCGVPRGNGRADGRRYRRFRYRCGRLGARDMGVGCDKGIAQGRHEGRQEGPAREEGCASDTGVGACLHTVFVLAALISQRSFRDRPEFLEIRTCKDDDGQCLCSRREARLPRTSHVTGRQGARRQQPARGSAMHDAFRVFPGHPSPTPIPNPEVLPPCNLPGPAWSPLPW